MTELAKTCWQHQVKQKNLKEDLRKAKLTKDRASKIRVNHLQFEYVDKTDIQKCIDIKKFIERHEWLGKMPARPTHRFIATYRSHIVGVVVMATPYAFTTVFGKENSHLEKLIARGATISWAPKNTGSWLIMNSINWMVKNTEFRFFSGYSDTAANELGTIYQACGFYYLGQGSGTKNEYYDPDNPQRGWFSDRLFRKTGQYKKYAKELGIKWDPKWVRGYTVLWYLMPIKVADQLRKASKDYQNRCLKRKVQRKHKYTYLKCPTKSETRRLLRKFYAQNPKFKPETKSIRPGLPYPKERGVK